MGNGRASASWSIGAMLTLELPPAALGALHGGPKLVCDSTCRASHTGGPSTFLYRTLRRKAALHWIQHLQGCKAAREFGCQGVWLGPGGAKMPKSSGPGGPRRPSKPTRGPEKGAEHSSGSRGTRAAVTTTVATLVIIVGEDAVGEPATSSPPSPPPNLCQVTQANLSQVTQANLSQVTQASLSQATQANLSQVTHAT